MSAIAVSQLGVSLEIPMPMAFSMRFARLHPRITNGSTVGRQLVRGILGSLMGRR